MGRPLRAFSSEEALYFVTAKTADQRLLLRPSSELNEIVGGVMARSLALHRDEVYLRGAFVASDHIHLLVRVKGDALSPFMQHFLGNVARQVNRLYRRTGPLWSGRYLAGIILDETAELERLQFLYSHGAHEGFQNPELWPGFSSAALALWGPQKFPWPVRKSDAPETHTISIEPPNAWRREVPKRQHQRLRDFLRDIQKTSPGVAPSNRGPVWMRRRNPFARGTSKYCTPHRCYSSSSAALEKWSKATRAFVADFHKKRTAFS
jgi:Transposase IS200 like